MNVDSIITQLSVGLPETRTAFGELRNYDIAMRDDIHLRTRVFLPKGSGPWPAILMRNPYPHVMPYLQATATVWTRYGYAVVLQDCRGTGASAGVWKPFENERADGLDTIDWLCEQPWMNGNIGTSGHSYLSSVQWAIADIVPKQVKTMVLSGFTTERYRQNYMNGMFRMDVYTGWALDNAGSDPIESEDLFARATHIRPHIEMDEQLFGRQLNWYRQWITSVSPRAPYWNEGFWAEFREIPRRIRIPVLMTDGWFDQHVDGMIRDYLKLPEATRAASRFILGPWVHSMQTSGDMPYPNSHRNQMLEALEWFDHHLLGMDYPHDKGDVTTYVIGSGRWRSWDLFWQLGGRKTLYLSGSRNLLEKEPNFPEQITYAYDPEQPVLTKGGAGLLRYLSGAQDAAPPASVAQAPPGYRDDVISFLSEPFTEDLTITGSITVHLFVSADVNDTAFTTVFMDVLEDGTTYNIRDGITSLAYRNESDIPLDYEPGTIAEIEIRLWPITWTIRKGHRIRLDISSSNFPAYHIHPNFAGPWALQTKTRTANQTIYCGGRFDTRMIIPFSQEGGEA
ncbi:CocE/NonD family hydrolase [Paenibacillus sp. VMFN-D1]|uniref:CocE/NonD family hydrolase n=1 Tax=Paenibacillus sp. VMFN-D1 TaxID=2135608 RepID=UPI000E274A89|nr:CocE/NonD family hydrolase [Paenibacillus sp. VMFN-D1]RED41834.1 hypothetical protein C7820_3023 [Paenibacillus sp. VMFN-D1]